MRLLGIPALEDKIVQQAARMLLEPIYEQEFLGFSYGFRPGRSQYQALDALAVAIMRKVSWVFNAGTRASYDTIDHAWMQKFIEHKIADRRMVRLLMKWLHAGVMEKGELHEVQKERRKGVESALCCRISTCTTCSTCGPNNGASATHEVKFTS